MKARQHWWALRLASLPLVPLFIYFLFQRGLFAHDRDTFVAAAGAPLTGTLLVAFIACATIHAILGVEEIIVDYVPEASQKIWLCLNKLVFAALGLASILAVLSFMVHA